MATNIEQIIENVRAFRDLTAPTVMASGAGGGRLIDDGRGARHVIAVDTDAAAILLLADAVRDRGLPRQFTVVHSDFLSLRARPETSS